MFIEIPKKKSKRCNEFHEYLKNHLILNYGNKLKTIYQSKTASKITHQNDEYLVEAIIYVKNI